MDHLDLILKVTWLVIANKSCSSSKIDHLDILFKITLTYFSRPYLYNTLVMENMVIIPFSVQRCFTWTSFIRSQHDV